MALYDFTSQTDASRILNRVKRLETNVPRLKGGVMQTTASGMTTVPDPSAGPNLPASRVPRTRIRVIQRP